MSHLARFLAYAAAFEKAYESDDWSLIEPFFTDDVVYDSPLPEPFGGRPEGRAAVIAHLQQSVDQLDRRFESRELEPVGGPIEEGDTVRIRGRVRYRAAGFPDFVLELEEIAHFEGDRIRRLEDVYAPDQVQAILDYARDHGEALGLATG